MRKAIMVVLFMFLTGWPAYGQTPSVGSEQGNTAILFEGSFLKGSAKFLGEDKKWDSTKNVFPGVEVRLNQNGRVTIGVGYQRWQLDTPSETYLQQFLVCDRPTAGGCPISAGTRTITHHPQTGEPLASTTFANEAVGNVFSSTAYLNLLKKGRVRPFVAGGGGVVFLKKTFHTKTFVHPNIKEVIGREFRFEKPENTYSESSLKALIKAVGGVNIFPMAHTIISLSGGYHNGTAFSLGLGYIW